MKRIWIGIWTVLLLMMTAVPVYAEEITLTAEQREQLAVELKRQELGVPEDYTVDGTTRDFTIYQISDPDITAAELAARDIYDYLLLQDGKIAGICWFYEGIGQVGYCHFNKISQVLGAEREELMQLLYRKYGNDVMFCREEMYFEDPTKDGCLVFDPDTPEVMYRFRLSQGIESAETIDFSETAAVFSHEYRMANHQRRSAKMDIFYDSRTLKKAERYHTFRWWYEFWYGLWYGGDGIKSDFVYGGIAVIVAAVIVIKRQIKRVKEGEI